MARDTAHRIPVLQNLPAAYDAYKSFADTIQKAAADAGVDTLLVQLVKIRASQLNGCAYCLDMHAAEALRAGESQRRLFVLDGWREANLFTEQERAALELTEVLTGLPHTRELPGEVYERATAVFTEDQYTAVVWLIVVINGWNRMTVAGHSPLPRRAG